MASQPSYSRHRRMVAGQQPVSSDISNDTPPIYARRLAGYIRDPSTIRVRVLERYGHCPPREVIVRMLDDQARATGKPWNFLQKREHDHLFSGIHRKLPPTVAMPEPDPELTPMGRAHRTAKDMIAEAAGAFGLTYADIVAPGGKARIKRVRFMLAQLMVDRGNSRSQVARWLGRTCHSTVCHAMKVFPRMLQDHPDIARAYAHFRKEWGID